MCFSLSINVSVLHFVFQSCIQQQIEFICRPDWDLTIENTQYKIILWHNAQTKINIKRFIKYKSTVWYITLGNIMFFYKSCFTKSFQMLNVVKTEAHTQFCLNKSLEATVSHYSTRSKYDHTFEQMSRRVSQNAVLTTFWKDDALSGTRRREPQWW